MLPAEIAPIVSSVGGLVALMAGFVAARFISRWAAWEPAGPIALIAAAPVVPRIPILFSLSSDDLLPLLGIALLIWRMPVPRLPKDRILLGLLVAAAITTLARIASALVNGGGLEGTVVMVVQAIARPLVLVAIAGYVAVATPEANRHRAVALAIASVGTFEAAFGLFAFVVPLPGHAGLEAARQLTSLYDVCPGRISGTLGLSPNHLGAVFVLSIPFTLGLAVLHSDWRRWAWAFGAAVQGAALALTFTRSSILLGAALTVIFLVYERRFLLLAAVTAVAGILLVSALSLGCTTGSGGPGLPGNPGGVLGGRFSDGNDRLALWYSAGLIMVDHPLFGIGLEQMTDFVRAHPGRYRDTPFGPATSSAHNTILLAGAETGVAGGLAVLVINIGVAFIAARCAWRGRRREDAIFLAAGLALAGYLTQGMVNNLFSVPATSAVFALTVGAFAASRQAKSTGTGDPAATGAAPLDPYTSPSSEANTPGGDH
jgi:O-antigen ligase